MVACLLLISSSVTPNIFIKTPPIESKTDNTEMSNKLVYGANVFCETAKSLLLPSILITQSDNFPIELFILTVKRAIFPPISLAFWAIAVEEVAEAVDDIIKQKAKVAGYKTTKLFSCGYGDWQIENQDEILRLLDADKIGVTVNEVHHMIPRKSITAVLGWEKKL